MKSLLVCSVALVLIAIAKLGLLAPTVNAQTTQKPEKPTVFRIKYVSDATVYLEAGRNAGLQEGMKLSVVNPPPDNSVSEGVRFRGGEHVAELKVSSVADSSAVCEIVKTNAELKTGQLAFLTPESVTERRQAETAAAIETDNYPIILTFTYGDPLEDEIRDEQIKKQMPPESPIGQIRGRFGLDYGGTRESGGYSSTQTGLLVQTDMTHIGGTYWNFRGYWRGRFTTSSASNVGTAPTTLTDLINRTYHIGFFYDSPYSPTTIGVGRLFLPWAPSLSTIDGGYLGRKLGRIVTVGVFGGSTPDPTSWSYNPNQHIAGTFLNFTDGDFDRLHYISTMGIALTSIQWKVARQFAFFENTFSWKRYVSFYNSLQADEARTSPLVNGGSNPTGITQSYSTIHFQPFTRLGFGINHNYFRNLPTFDPRLVSTGLLDKYLFQGFSGDVRVELPFHISAYTSLGRSKASTDSKNSLNEGYGLTFGQIWKTGVHADLHYSKFNSVFGSGNYESISLSRNLTDTLHLLVMGGIQKFNSSLSSNNNSNFLNATLDWTVSSRYFLSSNFSVYRGTTLNYQQWSMILGYRFGGLHK